MTLKALIQKYGKEKINTLTKYPSILTLHKFGEKGRLTDDFTTNIEGETMYATEKIDGTNVRIVSFGDKFLIGSRKCILHYSDDFYWDESMDIVKSVFELGVTRMATEHLTIVFGELYGGKVTANSKNYGKEKHGFRVFDMAVIEDLSVLDSTITEISNWREHTLNSTVDDTLAYGQNFLNRSELATYADQYELVPNVEFDLGDMKHQTILDALNQFIPETQVALTESAQKRPEGVVIRNENRTKIVKLRFEDYQRTLKRRER